MAASIETIIGLGGVPFSMQEYNASEGKKRAEYDNLIAAWRNKYGDGNINEERNMWDGEAEISWRPRNDPAMQAKREKEEANKIAEIEKYIGPKFPNPINEIRKKIALRNMDKAKNNDEYLIGAVMCISVADGDMAYMEKVLSNIKSSGKICPNGSNKNILDTIHRKGDDLKHEAVYGNKKYASAFKKIDKNKYNKNRNAYIYYAENKKDHNDTQNDKNVMKMKKRDSLGKS